jgi:hypothetical protein
MKHDRTEQIKYVKILSSDKDDNSRSFYELQHMFAFLYLGGTDPHVGIIEIPEGISVTPIDRYIYTAKAFIVHIVPLERIINRLIKDGADISTHNYQAINNAAMTGNMKVLDILTRQKNVNLDCIDNENFRTATAYYLHTYRNGEPKLTDNE